MKPTLDLVLSLNRHFAQRYAQSKATAVSDTLVSECPTIIRLESALVLLRGGARERAEILGERYHAYKAAAHVPATLALALTQATPPTTPQLRALQRDLTDLLESKEPDAAMRQATEPCKALLDAWLAVRRETPDGTPPLECVDEFKRDAQRAIGPCMLAAARCEIDSLHAIVSAWTKGFSEKEWRSLKVVICASHQARYRESTKLYFRRLLVHRLGHEPQDESRTAEGEHQVIYAENCASEDDALNLLAMHHVDRDLAEWLLGERTSLQRDVIGDTFAELLDELFD
ncbi:MAG: hypothetical protein AB7K71_18500 [Polyangiaceae bacterium]